MKSILDQLSEVRPIAAGGRGSGGRRDTVRTVTGRLRVHETELEGYPVERPLKGIGVAVQVAESAAGPWAGWGLGRTGADGSYAVSGPGDGNRFFRVLAMLVGPDLRIEDGTGANRPELGLADRNGWTIWESGTPVDGPTVEVGSRLIGSGQPCDLGDPTFRRQALVWYVLRTTIDRLAAEDPWYRIGRPLTVLYPARGVAGASYRSGERLYLDQDRPDWRPDELLFLFWQAWQDSHTTGIRKLARTPSAAFATGFSAFAATAWLHLAWGRRLPRPASRHHLAVGLALSSLDQVERDDFGVQNVLRLLHHPHRHGWWSHLFGTPDAYPANRPDDDGDGVPDFRSEAGVNYRLDPGAVPPEPDHLTFWQLLRTFKPDPAHGWPTSLEVGDESCGVLRFVARAVDIHALGETTRRMLLDAIDPAGTAEPHQSLARLAA